jgi:peptidoglycan/LPS O-acetylase OafA/YrhL
MSTPKYYPALDGLRGLAILLVLVHNTSINEENSTIVEKLWVALTDGGWIGVQLFFVLSGYLITGLLLDGRSQPHALRSFYVRRSLRIFPLYYVFLIGRLLVVPYFVPSLSVPFWTQIWFWLYLSNWSDLIQGGIQDMGHFWSLAVEEQFYLTWPAVVRRVRPRTLTWICLAIMVISPAVRVAFYAAEVNHGWIYSSTISRADGLASGALVALATRATIDRAKFVEWRQRIGVGAALVLFVVLAKAHGLSRYNPIVVTLGYTALALLFAVVIATVVDPAPPKITRVLDNPLLRTIGRYSYAMYVLHLPLRWTVEHYAKDLLASALARHPIPTAVAWFGLITVLSFAVAAVSFAVLESPFLKLKDRWAPR